jgi:putative membrane protein
MNTKLNALAAALVAAAWAGVAFAATTAADREFATTAAKANAAEIAIGRLAATHSQDANVKAFGQRMVDDHTKAAEGLKAAATEDGIALPPEPASNADADQLARLQGADFDRAFGMQMRADHDKAVALFRKESTASGDAHVKAFAAKTLPTLEEHQKMAQSLPGATK